MSPTCPLFRGFAANTSKSPVQYPDCNCHKFPALPADVSPLAAGPDVVVVCHIDVKHQLFPQGLEAGLLDATAHARSHGENGTDVDLVRTGLPHAVLQGLSALEGLVPHVHIVFQGERKLSMREGVPITCKENLLNSKLLLP